MEPGTPGPSEPGSINSFLTSWAELKDHCRKFGEVTYTDAHFRSGEGKGEVCFAERGDMERGKFDNDAYRSSFT